MPNKESAKNEWKVRWAEQQERKIVLVRWLYLMRVKSELKSALVTGDNHRKNFVLSAVCKNITHRNYNPLSTFTPKYHHHPSPTNHLFLIGPTRLPILTGQASPPLSNRPSLPPKPCAFSPPTTPSTTAGTKSQQPTGSNTVPGTKNPPMSLPSTHFPATSTKKRVSFVPNAS